MKCCDPNHGNFGCSFVCPTTHDCNFTETNGALPDVIPYHNPYGGWPGDPSWATAGAVIPREIVVTRGEACSEMLYNVTKNLVDWMNRHGDTRVGGVINFGKYSLHSNDPHGLE
jgi:hypothetical protein